MHHWVNLDCTEGTKGNKLFIKDFNKAATNFC